MQTSLNKKNDVYRKSSPGNYNGGIDEFKMYKMSNLFLLYALLERNAT